MIVIALLPALALLGAVGSEPPQHPASRPHRVEVSPRSGVSARDAAVLLSGQVGGPLGLSALAFAPAFASHDVPFVLDVEPPADGRGLAGHRFSLTLYAFGGDGAVVGHLLADAAIPRDDQGEGAAHWGAKFLATIPCRDDAATVRALVRDLDGGAFGLAGAEVPAVDGTDSRVLGPPVVPQSGDGWFTALLGAPVAPPAVAGWPFAPEGAPVLPSTHPGAVRGPVTLWLLARSAPLAAQPRCRIVAEDGHAEPCSAALTGRGELPGEGRTALAFAVEIPDLGPGRHQLELSLEAEGQPSLLASLAVGGAAAAGGPPSFLPPAESKTNAAAADRPTVARVRATYLEAIAGEATGSTEAALRAVAALESGTLVRGTSDEFDDLLTGEIAVARSLLDRDPQAGLGLILLHLELYNAYLQELRYLPLAHARAQLNALDTLLERRRDPALASCARDALTSMAGTLLEVGSTGSAEALFKRLLARDPANPAGALGLAGQREEAGALAEAATVLERMLEAHPDHVEGRLRLGVIRHRLGETERAELLLAACQADASSPGWVRSIAGQQRARLRLDGDRPGAAAELLESETAPDGATVILLAYALEANGQVMRSRTTLNRLLNRSPQDEDESARFRYTQAARSEIEAARRRLSELKPRALTALREAAVELRRSAS